jgi:hypothetical protein
MPPRQVSTPRLTHVAYAAQQTEAEVTARFAAVFFRWIRDKELYRPSGWPSWRAFCAYFIPAEPERIDILIRARRVDESDVPNPGHRRHLKRGRSHHARKHLR